MNKISIMASVAALAAASMALAQGGGQHDKFKGNLSRQQVLQRADAAFQNFDVDRDGRITPAEAQRVHEQMRARMSGGHTKTTGAHGGQSDMHGFFDRLFRNGSSVTRAEFRQKHLSLFAWLDRDRNGVLTPAEHKQMRAQFDH